MQSIQMIKTPYRRIITAFPHPEAQLIVVELDRIEPVAMHGQPHVVWHRASGFTVEDPWGNRFIDFTSGVLVANCGHSHPRVKAAISAQLEQDLLMSYIFPTRERVEFISNLLSHAPKEHDQALLFNSGSEAIEASIKLARQHAIGQSGLNKRLVISFEGSFHGRTLGSQLAGGLPSLKEWIGPCDLPYKQFPFPDCEKSAEHDFDNFIYHLAKTGFAPNEVCCIVFESYLGGTVSFADAMYVQKLREWCNQNHVCLIFDEIQSGFGRTGLWWGFEHYGVEPDLIACGKGISGSLPMSAVIGRREIMNSFKPGAMSTTHSGNPLCCAAANASLNVLVEESLVDHARNLGNDVSDTLGKIAKNRSLVGSVSGKGLVYGIRVIDPITAQPSQRFAQEIVDKTVARGVLLFNPVGPYGATIKITPPLCIAHEAMQEGLEVIDEVISQIEEALIP